MAQISRRSHDLLVAVRRGSPTFSCNTVACNVHCYDYNDYRDLLGRRI
jgi:hypothetical protein